MRNVSDQFFGENQIKYTRIAINNPLFGPENRTVHEIMWKNIVEPYRLQMTIWNGAYTLHAGYLRPQTHTQMTYYFLQQRYANASQCYVWTYVACLLLHIKSDRLL